MAEMCADHNSVYLIHDLPDWTFRGKLEEYATESQVAQSSECPTPRLCYDASRALIQTRVDDAGRFVPAPVLCLGSFQGSPPTGSISYVERIAAAKTNISLTANCRPLHMLTPPPFKFVSKHQLRTIWYSRGDTHRMASPRPYLRQQLASHPSRSGRPT